LTSPLMRTIVRGTAGLLLVTSVVGASAQPMLRCSGAIAELMFGRKVDDRIAVTEKRWARAVDREITPRLDQIIEAYKTRFRQQSVGSYYSSCPHRLLALRASMAFPT
jgi:hypothetical protein